MTNPTVIDVLVYMKRLLRKGWTQGVVARSKSGRKVDCLSKSAVSFCLLGAKRRAEVDLNARKPVPNKVWRLLWETSGRKGTQTFNEVQGRTKRQILAVVERAIEMA